MEHFLYIANNKHQKKIADIDFYSDNLFKDVAILISAQQSDPVIDGNLGIHIYDFYGHEASFLLVCNSQKRFVRFLNNTGLESYIDHDPAPRFLTCLDESTNEYKYYQLWVEQDRCVCSDGRLGAKAGSFSYADGNTKKDGSFSYPAEMFWIKYYEKLSKGYLDQSDLRNFYSDKPKEPQYVPIKDSVVASIVDEMISNQREYVREHYDISISLSTACIEKADRILLDLQKIVLHTDCDDEENRHLFSDRYKELLITVPRNIQNIADYINRIDWYNPDSPFYILKILAWEQELFDIFCNLYKEEHPFLTDMQDEQKTILDKKGLTVRQVSFDELFMIYDYLGIITSQLDEVLAVSNIHTESKFKDYLIQQNMSEKDCFLMWHGSKTANWWSIVTNGLVLDASRKYNAEITGHMFGNGLYFAPSTSTDSLVLAHNPAGTCAGAKKSQGYVDFGFWNNNDSPSANHGFLALYSVAMGRSYHPRTSLSPSFSAENLPDGCKSIWAFPSQAPLKNEECIIFNQDACTIRYLIRISNRPEALPSFNMKELRNLKCEFKAATGNGVTITTDLGNYFANIPKMTDIFIDMRGIITVPLPLRGFEKKYLAAIVMSKFAGSKSDFLSRIRSGEALISSEGSRDIAKELCADEDFDRK